MKVLTITGTPGTGKSALAKKLAKSLNFQRIGLHKYYKQISSSYNKSKQSYNIDLKKFKQLIQEKAQNSNLVVDSHISHLLPKSLVKLCLVLICPDLKKLERRLRKRNYSGRKIRENLEAEIFQVCLNEAREMGHKVMVIDACQKVSQLDNNKLIRKIKKLFFPIKNKLISERGAVVKQAMKVKSGIVVI